MAKLHWFTELVAYFGKGAPKRTPKSASPATGDRPEGDFSDIEEALLPRNPGPPKGAGSPDKRPTPGRVATKPLPPAVPPPADVSVDEEDEVRSGKVRALTTAERQFLTETLLTSIQDARFAMTRPLPEECGQACTQQVNTWLAAGRDALQTHPETDLRGYIVGFDFGTSSSKIVLHQPSAGRPAVALPVPPELRSEGLEHLWRTAVWVDPGSGEFSLCPFPGGLGVDGFKVALLTGHERVPVQGVRDTEAACAYLALMIRVVLGFRTIERPQGFGQVVGFQRFHFGIPVACKGDQALTARFERLVTAAFGLAGNGSRVTLTAVKQALAEAAPRSNDDPAKQYILYEELAGVVSGYLQSSERRIGRHLAVDVGASTLDVTTFLLTEGAHPVHIYRSSVQPFGAEIWALLKGRSVSRSDFVQVCQHQVRGVWDPTHQIDDPGFRHEGAALLYVGGGRHSDAHKDLFHGWGKHFRTRPATPEPLSQSFQRDKATDPARLLLAWGLAQDEGEMREIRFPAPDHATGNSRKTYEDRFIGPDQM